MSKNLLKISASTIRTTVRHQARIPPSHIPPAEHSCGIEPWKMPRPPPPPLPKKFPEHLLRPPCMPGSEKGRFPPLCHTFKGYYCPVTRIKYMYPAFSDNIDFVPSGGADCWWERAPLCEFLDMDENLPIRI